MKFPLCLLVTLFLLASVQAQQKPQVNSIVIRNVSVIDIKKGRILKKHSVLVEGNRISEVKRGGKFPGEAIIVDGTGKFLIPGLWDMHVHLFNNSSRTGTDNHEAYFPLFIANGITGVRDMWSDPEDIRRAHHWRQQIESGELIGPRVAVGSSIVDGIPVFVKNSLGVSNAEEARMAVRTLKNSGAGFIKVYWNLSPEAYYAIADESKKLGIDFAGHVPFSISATAASEAGQKSIEHLTGIAEGCSSKEEELRKEKQNRPVADELLKTYDEAKCIAMYKRFARNKTWQTPTTVLHRVRVFRDQPEISKDERLKYVYKSEQDIWNKLLENRNDAVSIETRKQRYRQMLENIGKMQNVGVPLLAGSDLGNPYVIAGFSLHDELEQMVSSGLTPAEALRTATINPAIYLNMTDSLGIIEKGKLADLVLLDANPLENISNTKKIAGVLVNGRYISREEIKAKLQDAEVRAREN